MNAQIKISEAWKSIRDTSYPILFQTVSNQLDNCNTRACSRGALVEPGRTKITKSTFVSDASIAWNKTHKNCITIH